MAQRNGNLLLTSSKNPSCQPHRVDLWGLMLQPQDDWSSTQWLSLKDSKPQPHKGAQPELRTQRNCEQWIFTTVLSCCIVICQKTTKNDVMVLSKATLTSYWPNWSRQHIKKQRHHFAHKGQYSQNYDLSSSHAWMWELDHKEGWMLKNWCFRTVVLEKILESPLDCKKIKPVNPKGN